VSDGWSAGRRRRAAFVAALPLLLAGCGESESGGEGSLESGIAIEARLEPGCPGPATTQPTCGPAPYAGELEIADQATGEAVATATTDGAGHAEVAVPPGTYVIRTSAPGLPSLAPVSAEVFPGRVTEVEVAVDSGLR
jgi:hypothetical protein